MPNPACPSAIRPRPSGPESPNPRRSAVARIAGVIVIALGFFVLLALQEQREVQILRGPSRETSFLRRGSTRPTRESWASPFEFAESIITSSQGPDQRNAITCRSDACSGASARRHGVYSPVSRRRRRRTVRYTLRDLLHPTDIKFLCAHRFVEDRIACPTVADCRASQTADSTASARRAGSMNVAVHRLTRLLGRILAADRRGEPSRRRISWTWPSSPAIRVRQAWRADAPNRR